MIVNCYTTQYNEERLPVLVKECIANTESRKMLQSEDAYQAFMEMFNCNAYPQERLWMIALDNQLRIQAGFTVSIGDYHETFATPAEIGVRALLSSSRRIMLAHAHPYGTHEPSEVDIRTTKRIKHAMDILGIDLLDHLVIGREGFTSIRNEIIRREKEAENMECPELD